MAQVKSLRVVSWLGIVAAFVALLATIYVAADLYRMSDRYRQAQVLLTRVSDLSAQIGRLEAESASLPESAMAEEQRRSLQNQIEGLLAEVAELDPQAEGPLHAETALRLNSEAAGENIESALSGVLDPTGQQPSEELIEQSYAGLEGIVSEALNSYSRLSEQTRDRTTIVTAIAMAIGAVMIVWVLSLFEKARRATTEAANAQRTLRESEARFRSLIQNTADIICVIDANGVVRYQSVSIAALGYETDEVIGRNILEFIHPADANMVKQLLRRCLENSAYSPKAELCFQAADGEAHHFEIVCSNLLHEPEVAGIVLNARDLTEHKQFEQRLAHLASYDPLTDVFNRRRFEEELDIQLAQRRRYNENAALLFLDLDDFKNINDSLGHRTGDMVLVSLVNMLRKNLRESEIIGRFGGDEFVIFLPQANASQAQTVAERILGLIRHHTTLLDGKPVGSTASIGVAVFPDHGIMTDELLSHADLAMYQAKGNGKDCFRLYEPGSTWQREVESIFS